MMHSITVVFGPAATSWRLLYKSHERATAMSTSIMAGESYAHVILSDDFGQTASLRRDTIHGWMIEDLDQTKLAATEMMVHNARAQADAEQAMRADPKIMASARNRQQSPPILAPMGNGFTR